MIEGTCRNGRTRPAPEWFAAMIKRASAQETPWPLRVIVSARGQARADKELAPANPALRIKERAGEDRRERAKRPGLY